MKPALFDAPPCSRCGGPHPFDTSVPSDVWNAFAKDGDYWCLGCVIAEAAAADIETVPAKLYGNDFDGMPVVITIGRPR